jgi:acylphosphatase
VLAVHVIITGRVQGVGYRAWTEHEAQRLGLSGWVRNRRDGSVEAVFAGEDGDVTGMLAALWSGPRGSRVEDVSLEDFAGETPSGFQVLQAG